MATTVTYTGLISFAGREFRYTYEGPSQGAIDAEFSSMRSNTANSWKSDEQLLNEASAKLWNRVRTESADKALTFLHEALKKYAANTHVGISQLHKSPLALDKIASQCGLVPVDYKKEKAGKASQLVEPRPEPVLDPNGAREAANNDFDYMEESELRKVPTKLVDELNIELEMAWDAIPKGTGAKNVADAQFSKPDPYDSFGDQINSIALQAAGGGLSDSSISQEMFSLNRFGRTFVGPNRELTGWTFITRPHCNLQISNIASAPQFVPLVHGTPRSIPFAIKAWLDTTFANEVAGGIGRACPFVDFKNPFLVPLCNRLANLSGWPDFSVATETSEGGFFSENQTVSIGGDQLARGYDFPITFDEMNNGLIMSIFDYWTQYISMIGDGRLHQYSSDIENNLLGYTVSIYRFITDHTGRNITRWAKATGCYPKTISNGTVFNKNKGEGLVQSANEVSITFQVHRPEYNNPRILAEFNTLVDRYMGPWNENSFEMGNNIANNFMGIPYISQRGGRTQLVWRCDLDRNARRPLAVGRGSGSSVITG